MPTRYSIACHRFLITNSQKSLQLISGDCSIAAASSAEPDSDCSLDPPANLFGGAFPAVLAAIAPGSSAAGWAAFQLVEAVAAPEVELAYPGARRHLVVLPELLLLRPDSLRAVAVELALPLARRAYS